MTVQPFEINIEPAVLDDLRDRLRGTRWPDEIDSAGWDYGMNGLPGAGSPVPQGEPPARFPGQGARCGLTRRKDGYPVQYVTRIEELCGARKIRHWRRPLW
jgi:hypothetical protein